MFSFLRNFFRSPISSFVIDEVDKFRNVVVVEDKDLSLRVEIPIGEKPLKEAKIVEPYTILLTYEDGTVQKKRILK
jgi:hypothetical protein